MHFIAGKFVTRPFLGWTDPEVDIVVLIKHLPPQAWVQRLIHRSSLIYCPIDFFGNPTAIDDSAPLLRRCDRVVVHCERLRKYFEPYAPVDYLDHHVKFAAPMRQRYRAEGDLLWVGVRSNLPPLVEWVNEHPLPGTLDVLINLEDPNRPPTPAQLGFLPGMAVRIHDWSPHRQAAMTAASRAVIDIKGDDFRARHKPPAKGIDFIASGVPLAMNPGSSTVEHLGRMGFEVASPLEPERWLSRDYWEETRRFGLALRELLSLERVARRFKRILDEVWAARGGT